MTTPDETPARTSAEQPSRHDIKEVLDRVRDVIDDTEDQRGSDDSPLPHKVLRKTTNLLQNWLPSSSRHQQQPRLTRYVRALRSMSRLRLQ